MTAGLITPEQFVDLNEKIGGFDIDWKWQPQRMQADAGAVATAYRIGAVTDAKALANVPIIDLRGSSNNEIHTDFHSYELRARLDKANGNHDNQVIWSSDVSLAGDPAWNCGGAVGQGNLPCARTAPSWSWTTGSRESRPTTRPIRCRSRFAATSRRSQSIRAGSPAFR